MSELIGIGAELLFYMALPLVVGYAWIFGYHWYEYGTKKSHGTIALVVFLSGAVLILLMMFVSLRYVS